MRRRGIPANLDAAASAQVERTLLILRVVRVSLLALFLVVAAVAVKGWPHGATVVLIAVAAILAGRLVTDVRRLNRMDRLRQR